MQLERERKKGERKREIVRERNVEKLNETKLSFYCLKLFRRVARSSGQHKKGFNMWYAIKSMMSFEVAITQRVKTWLSHEKTTKLFSLFCAKRLLSHITTLEWINKNVQWFLMTSGTFSLFFFVLDRLPFFYLQHILAVIFHFCVRRPLVVGSVHEQRHKISSLGFAWNQWS